MWVLPTLQIMHPINECKLARKEPCRTHSCPQLKSVGYRKQNLQTDFNERKQDLPLDFNTQEQGANRSPEWAPEIIEKRKARNQRHKERRGLTSCQT